MFDVKIGHLLFQPDRMRILLTNEIAVKKMNLEVPSSRGFR